MAQVHAGHHVVVHEEQVFARRETPADFGDPLEHLEQREGGAEGQRDPEPSQRVRSVSGARRGDAECHKE